MRGLFAAIGFFMASAAFAAQTVTVDESFTATFSDYNEFDKMVTCTPGFRGGFATEDIITMKGHAIDKGITLYGDFTAYSDIGLINDPLTSTPEVRPYDEGCKPALEQIKAAIAGKDIVEVTVRRRVTAHPNTQGRVRRKVNGEVVSVNYVTVEQNYESFRFQLGGAEFFAGQLLNGKTL